MFWFSLEENISFESKSHSFYLLDDSNGDFIHSVICPELFLPAVCDWNHGMDFKIRPNLWLPRKKILPLSPIFQLKDILDVNRIMEIMRDNIGSVMAILESLLVIVRTNVNSVFNFVTGQSTQSGPVRSGQ